jgi:hypothetical protein
MDTNADPEAIPRFGPIAFLLLLLVAIALRFDTYGDPNLHGDEVFYHTVGVAMHHGALPYIDVWDRKPFGLFALFWLIAFVSESALAYQIVATLFAAGTAWAIGMIARTWTGTRGAFLAGLLYLLYLKPLQGFGGQSPVFYNLFIALAALLVLRALRALREGRVPRSVPLAMLVAGLGITIKTTALAEAAFLGLFAAAALWRASGPARTLRHAAGWALIGAAPTLAIAGTYWALGHFAEYWHAMVTSNLSKPPHWPTSLMRLRTIAVLLAPAAVLALLGLLRQSRERGFVVAWIAAAVVGLWSMPNFYIHYAMPLVVPLCIAAAAFLARGLVGGAVVGVLAVIALRAAPPQFGHAPASAAAIDRLVQDVKTHHGKGPLLIYDAPPQLYMLTDRHFTTPLVFPTHLSHLIEKDTSHLSTLGETLRVLTLRPGVVVMAVPPRNGPVNEETHQRVLAYVGGHCRLVDIVPTLEWQRTDMIAVWGDCR